jgi:hypothetical protein
MANNTITIPRGFPAAGKEDIKHKGQQIINYKDIQI